MNRDVITHRQKRAAEVILNGRKKKISIVSLRQTENLARKVASTLNGGDVIALSGELGSGKTTFVQFLATALGVKSRVTSPTFMLMKVHATGRQTRQRGIDVLCHIDAYRLSSVDGLLAIGVEDFIGRKDVVTVVEWAERVKPLFPSSTIWISLVRS